MTQQRFDEIKGWVQQGLVLTNDAASELLEAYASLRPPPKAAWPVLSQVDPRWKTRIMRLKSLGNSGCLVTAFTAWIGLRGGIRELVPPTPLDLDDYLDAHGGYTKGGDGMVWEPALAFARACGIECREVKFVETGGKPLTAFPFDPLNPPIVRVLTTPTRPGAKPSTHFAGLIDPVSGEIADPGTMKSGPHTLASRKYTPNRLTYIE